MLTEILKNNAEKFGNKRALTMRLGYRTVTLNYGDVYKLAQKFACLLEQKGISKGDKVIIVAPNSPYWTVVFWGCLLRGVILVPLNTQSTSEFVEKIRQQTEAKLVLTAHDVYLLREDLERVDVSKFLENIKNENDLVEILYTSGTTGDPKGAMLSHKNLRSNLEAVSGLIPAAKLSTSDRFLSILPLSHIFEQMAGFLLPFRVGAEIIYAHSPAVIVDLMREHRITKMAAVPEFLKLMMTKIENRPLAARFFLRNLDTVVARKFCNIFSY